MDIFAKAESDFLILCETFKCINLYYICKYELAEVQELLIAQYSVKAGISCAREIVQQTVGLSKVVYHQR